MALLFLSRDTLVSAAAGVGSETGLTRETRVCFHGTPATNLT